MNPSDAAPGDDREKRKSPIRRLSFWSGLQMGFLIAGCVFFLSSEMHRKQRESMMDRARAADAMLSFVKLDEGPDRKAVDAARDCLSSIKFESQLGNWYVRKEYLLTYGCIALYLISSITGELRAKRERNRQMATATR